MARPTLRPTPGPTLRPTPGPTLRPRPGPALRPRPGPALRPRARPRPGPTLRPTPGPTLRPTPGPTLRPRPGPALRPRARPRPRRSDRGAVTAELALALPALFAVLGLALWAVSAAGAAMACQDAARAGARAAARGDSPGAVRALVERTGPRGAQLEVRTVGALITVTVRATAHPPGPFPLPGFTVHGDAVAELEASR